MVLTQEVKKNIKTTAQKGGPLMHLDGLIVEEANEHGTKAAGDNKEMKGEEERKEQCN